VVEQTLLALKALFLVLLYVFVWRVIRAAARDLRVPQESVLLGPAQAAALGFRLGAAPSPRPRLVIAASSALEPGTARPPGRRVSRRAEATHRLARPRAERHPALQ